MSSINAKEFMTSIPTRLNNWSGEVLHALKENAPLRTKVKNVLLAITGVHLSLNQKKVEVRNGRRLIATAITSAALLAACGTLPALKGQSEPAKPVAPLAAAPLTVYPTITPEKSAVILPAVTAVQAKPTEALPTPTAEVEKPDIRVTATTKPDSKLGIGGPGLSVKDFTFSLKDFDFINKSGAKLIDAVKIEDNYYPDTKTLPEPDFIKLGLETPAIFIEYKGSFIPIRKDNLGEDLLRFRYRVNPTEALFYQAGGGLSEKDFQFNYEFTMVFIKKEKKYPVKFHVKTDLEVTNPFKYNNYTVIVDSEYLPDNFRPIDDQYLYIKIRNNNNATRNLSLDKGLSRPTEFGQYILNEESTIVSPSGPYVLQTGFSTNGKNYSPEQMGVFAKLSLLSFSFSK